MESLGLSIHIPIGFSFLSIRRAREGREKTKNGSSSVEKECIDSIGNTFGSMFFTLPVCRSRQVRVRRAKSCALSTHHMHLASNRPPAHPLLNRRKYQHSSSQPSFSHDKSHNNVLHACTNRRQRIGTYPQTSSIYQHPRPRILTSPCLGISPSNHSPRPTPPRSQPSHARDNFPASAFSHRGRLHHRKAKKTSIDRGV